MILKMSHKNMDTGRKEWQIYDNIVTATSGYNTEEKCKMLFVYFKGADEYSGFPIKEVAYLCNDDGKTIEAIYPEITSE
jgi:hypothetical protein